MTDHVILRMHYKHKSTKQQGEQSQWGGGVGRGGGGAFANVANELFCIKKLNLFTELYRFMFVKKWYFLKFDLAID